MAAPSRIPKAEFIESTHEYQELFRAEMNTTENQMTSERYYVNSIVLAYTKRRTVQDIAFTGWRVYPIGLTRARFKVFGYLSRCSISLLSSLSYMFLHGFLAG